MDDIFKYNDLDIPDCSFRISPSSIGTFFNYPSIWYKDNVLGEKSFTASTASVLGTIVHACAESYAKNTPITRAMISTYIMETIKTQPITESPILIEEINSSYPSMAEVLINQYIAKNKPTEVESQIYAPILDDIYIGGSCDNRTGDTVVDYKTTSGTPPKTIPFNYKIQALAYAYIFRYNSIPINRIRIVYVTKPKDTRAISEKTGKPIGKIFPSELTVLTEVISDDDWIMIEQTLELIAETIKVSRSNPELVHLLFKSMKLKGEIDEYRPTSLEPRVHNVFGIDLTCISWTLELNQHLVYYEKVEDYYDNAIDMEGINPELDIYEFSWYPNTPVGHCTILGNTIEEILLKLLKEN